MNGMYFSGTGNTKYCTEAFAQATGGRACSMESDEALEILRASDEIALGYPIYFSDIPRIVKAFILKHADMFRGKRVFVIATMGLFSGDGAGLAARLLRKCGAAVTGGLHLHMPDCIADVKLLKKTPKENRGLIAAAQKKILQAAEGIKRGIYPKDGLSFFHRIAGLFGQRLWFKMHAKKLTERLKIKTDRCIGCGICAAHCPTKSLYIENSKAVFYPGNCTICYRCINNCPAKAITLIGTDVFEQCRFDNYAKKGNTMKKLFTLFFCAMIFNPSYSMYSQTADGEVFFDTEIVVTGIKEKSGTIVISIHDSSESFRKRLPYRTAETAADGEKAVYRIRLKAGEYAFCVYHDVNGDGKLNTNAIGIPKEPFGFSNYDGKGPPGNFKKHKVFIDGTATVTIPLVKMN